jgi:hypothetical protein
VDLRLLGPLEVRFDDGPVELGPRKQRAVLAMLALEPGRTVLTTDPRAANAMWAKAEQRVLAAVPAIPVLNPVHTDLVSTRVRNDQYHPEWGLLLDQVSVR